VLWRQQGTLNRTKPSGEISGLPEIRAEDVEAVVVGSDLRRTGWFSSSDPQLDRFHDNVVWGMRGNFLDVPTDCPQRDERLGWTGDIQVFAPTASFLFDSAGFLTSWLADLRASQGLDPTRWPPTPAPATTTRSWPSGSVAPRPAGGPEVKRPGLPPRSR
jgi:hypothetical protein